VQEVTYTVQEATVPYNSHVFFQHLV